MFPKPYFSNVSNCSQTIQGHGEKTYANGVGGNELGARAHALVGLLVGELVEGEELVDDDLGSNQLANRKEILLGDTQQPSDRIHEISENKLQREDRVLVILAHQAPVLAPPTEKAVDKSNNGNDAQKSGNDHASNLDTEPGTVGKSVKGVRGPVLVVLGNHNATRCEGLLRLGVAHLGDSQRSRNRHDAGRHKGLGVKTKTNVSNQDGTGNGGETAGHDLMDFGLGQVRDERTDQHGRLALTNEGGGSSDDGFGTGDAESPEEEDGELANEPLDESQVVAELDKGDEEDDGRNDTGEEPGKVGNRVISQENDTGIRETEQSASHLGNEAEDIITGLGLEHEDGDDELGEHATNNRVPGNLPPVARGAGKDGDHDDETEEGDGAHGARVLADFFRNHTAEEENTDCAKGGKGLMKLLRDQSIAPMDRVLPYHPGGTHDDAGRQVAKDDAQADGDIDEGRLQPSEMVMSVIEKWTVDPPSKRKPKHHVSHQLSGIPKDDTC